MKPGKVKDQRMVQEQRQKKCERQGEKEQQAEREVRRGDKRENVEDIERNYHRNFLGVLWQSRT